MQPAERDRLRAGDRLRVRGGAGGRRVTARGPLPRRDHGAVRGGERGTARPRPRAPRLGVEGTALAGRGGPQGGPAARRGRHLQSGAGDRHGRGRPGDPGRVAAVRGLGPAAGRACRTPGRRRLHRRGLPQVPGRPRAGGRRHRADARGLHRGPADPVQPPGRARPADRRHGRARQLAGRRPAGPGPPGGSFRLAPRVRVHGGARHARRALPFRRLRGVAAPRGVGPRHRHRHGPPRCPEARRHLGRHHPRPRALRCLPGRRGPEEGRRTRRRARRGDGLRIPGRRRLHPGHHVLADRGHHEGPGPRLARPRRPGPTAVLEGRPTGPAPGAGPRTGRVPPRARWAVRRGRQAEAAHGRTRRLGRGQHPVLPRRAAAGLRPRPGRPDRPRREFPGRAG